MENQFDVEPHEQIAGDLGEKLKEITTGCRLEIRSFSCKRRMTDTQREKMAHAFSADSDAVSGSRSIINLRLPVVKPIFLALRHAHRFWKENTIKYEDGVRFIRTDRIAWMNARISEFQKAADEAAHELADSWQAVKDDAKARLAELYDEDDYDFDPANAFGITISYPAIEPDSRLKTLAPELYEAERKKVEAQFKEAAIIAEQALQDEFMKLVQHMLDKLDSETEEGGKKVIIRQSGIDALVDFSERFKSLSIGSNTELEKLVEAAKALAGGQSVKSLKKDDVKADFKAKLAEVGESLTKYIAESPIRKFNFE